MNIFVNNIKIIGLKDIRVIVIVKNRVGNYI